MRTSHQLPHFGNKKKKKNWSIDVCVVYINLYDTYRNLYDGPNFPIKKLDGVRRHTAPLL